MKKEQNTIEKAFTKKVRDFLTKHDLNLYKICRKIKYTNVEKLDDFIYQGVGSMTSGVMGRIENFIKEYKPKTQKQ